MTTVETTETGEVITDDGTSVTFNPEHQLCLQRLEELQGMLLAKDPAMPGHLAAIHKQLIQFDELVHLLTDEQIGIIMASQQQHSKTVLVGSATTKTGKAAAARATKGITIDML